MNLKIKLILILFFSLSSSFSYGQIIPNKNLDSLLTDFVKDLQLKGIDTICIYSDYLVGGVYVPEDMNDTCDYSPFYLPVYIFWIERGKTFLSKKDNCFDYSVVNLDSASFWQYFVKNKNFIKKEKVKPFEYVFYENNNKEILSILKEHSHHQYFKIIINGNKTGLDLDEFALEEESDGEKNINFLHNQKLKSKQLIDKINKTVQIVESETKFTKERRNTK
jgi:hypothetical protein